MVNGIITWMGDRLRMGKSSENSGSNKKITVLYQTQRLKAIIFRQNRENDLSAPSGELKYGINSVD